MSRVFLDVNVSPASLTMSPEKNHIEEGGRVSVSCTAVGVSIENEFLRFYTILSFWFGNSKNDLVQSSFKSSHKA